MIAAPPLIGRMAVQNQRDAIALEQIIRAHVWAWLETLDVFSRPNLLDKRLRAAEQAVRDAEWAQDWPAVEANWARWLEILRGLATC
jgi:hypothetical protein